MTKEELEKEADNYANNLERELMKEYEDYPEYGQCSYLATIPVPHARSAYLAGAEPREKRIAKLEAQIENMKCCGNCEHATHDSMNGTFCNYYSEWEHADLKCTQWELRR